jgi:hypothetical protein
VLSDNGADIRLGEKGHPAPLSDNTGAGFNSKHMSDGNGFRLAEFTYGHFQKLPFRGLKA